MAAKLSAIRASRMRGRLPSASSRPVRCVTPISVPALSNTSTIRKLNTTIRNVASNMREKSSWNSVGMSEGGADTMPPKLASPSGIPMRLTIRMPISVLPMILRELNAAIRMKPRRHSSAGHCARSPSVTRVAGLATTILDSSSAMIPRKRPTPAEIASFRFFGIALMTYSRMRKSEISRKITPEQNTPASACCQVYL